jgi:hypothetical protein
MKRLQPAITNLQNWKKDCKEYNNPHEIATPKPPPIFLESYLGGPDTFNGVMVCFQFGLFLAQRLAAKCKQISVRTDTVALVGFRIHYESLIMV